VRVVILVRRLAMADILERVPRLSQKPRCEPCREG
jgi:hypothetical protein